MNQEIAHMSDPGLELGKVVVKIGQVLMLLLAMFFFYLAYLDQFGFFSDWNIQLDPDISWLFPSLNPETIISIFCIGAGFKFLLILAFLIWIDRKIK